MLTIRLRATDLPGRRFHLVYEDALLVAFGTRGVAREVAALLAEFPWGQLLAPDAPREVQAATARLARAAGELAIFWCGHRRALDRDSVSFHRTYRALLEEFSRASEGARGSLRPTHSLPHEARAVRSRDRRPATGPRRARTHAAPPGRAARERRLESSLEGEKGSVRP